MEEKIEKGQFYTKKSPFSHPLFKDWVDSLGVVSELLFVEPFAGSNNLIKMTKDIIPFNYSQWKAYDIAPEAISINQVPEVPIIKNDSIANPPVSNVVITNPPYLAKNSAKKLGYNIDFKSFQDLWELSIDNILKTTDYVAAIIPESFITRKIFTDRLNSVISITDNLFDDTDFPVCLALWGKDKTEDFTVAVGDNIIGSYNDLIDKTPLETTSIDKNVKVVFNDPNGILGLKAIDNTDKASIKFMRGKDVKSEIKVTSRAYTRISVIENGKSLITNENIDKVIKDLNNYLNEYRNISKDVFLTNFKGLRKDGVYRRRLDWVRAKKIIQEVLGSGNNELSLFSISL